MTIVDVRSDKVRIGLTADTDVDIGRLEKMDAATIADFAKKCPTRKARAGT